MLVAGKRGGWWSEGLGASRSVMTARVVGGMMRERRTTLMSRCQDFGKGSIFEVRKGGSFGEFECRCMRNYST